MAALDDFDQVTDQSHLALSEFHEGNPEPMKAMFSHRDDVSLANPFGPAVLGWEQVGRHEIRLQVAEGDLVVSHIVGRGMHAGELLGIPATNNEVETEGIAIHRVREGKIAEYWSVTDVARVLQQVGALPGPDS